jgi:hypothetical protein
VSSTDPCSANPVSQYLAGNYFLCRQKSELIAQGQAEIQGVATNAATYYGADSQAAQVAQAAADANKAAVSLDVNQITADNASRCSGIDLSIVGLDCVQYWKIGAIVALVLAIVLAPYFLPLLLPRRS